LRDLAPLRTVVVSRAIADCELVDPAVVHFPFPADGTAAEKVESTVAEPSKPPSSPKKLCPRPVAAESASAITAAAARPRREGDSREFKFKFKLKRKVEET